MSNPNFISGLKGPTGIAFDSCGNLYVANLTGDTIGKYSSTGATLNASFISGLNRPSGIAFDRSDNLYVTNYIGNTIGKYSSTGATLNASFISGLNRPEGIAFDSTGNLYVANWGSSKIGKYSSTGATINESFISSGLFYPQGIAFDSYDNLYVTNYGDGKIVKYSSTGATLNASFISGLNRPKRIAFDSSGNLYVTNNSGNKIGKYVIPYPPPTISSISPIFGIISGGTSVTITGTQFVPNITTVKFGSTFATSVNVNSSRTSITCVTPIGLVGLVDVVVTTYGGLATLTNGFTYIEPPISNICFPAGTHITTNQGTFPIEKINTKIHTIRNKKIVGITQTITQDKYLVCFEKDSLGINLPSQKTIISKNHCIFYKGKMMQSKEFISKFENVKKIKYNGEILYNVLMEEDDKMMVNNLICQTLHPENSIAKLYKYLQNVNPKEKQKIIEEYNEYAIKNKVFSSKNN